MRFNFYFNTISFLLFFCVFLFFAGNVYALPCTDPYAPACTPQCPCPDAGNTAWCDQSTGVCQQTCGNCACSGPGCAWDEFPACEANVKPACVRKDSVIAALTIKLIHLVVHP